MHSTLAITRLMFATVATWIGAHMAIAPQPEIGSLDLSPTGQAGIPSAIPDIHSTDGGVQDLSIYRDDELDGLSAHGLSIDLAHLTEPHSSSSGVVPVGWTLESAAFNEDMGAYTVGGMERMWTHDLPGNLTANDDPNEVTDQQPLTGPLLATGSGKAPSSRGGSSVGFNARSGYGPLARGDPFRDYVELALDQTAPPNRNRPHPSNPGEGNLIERVPDGGDTLMLLGLGLGAALLFHRQQRFAHPRPTGRSSPRGRTPGAGGEALREETAPQGGAQGGAWGDPAPARFRRRPGKGACRPTLHEGLSRSMGNGNQLSQQASAFGRVRRSHRTEENQS